MSSLRNPFISAKKIQSGHLAKNMGELFENMLKNACIKEHTAWVRIPDGCRMVRTRSGAVVPQRTTTPFDYLIAFDGMAACIDCKTVESGNFSYSMITQHQANSLVSIYDKKVMAGYLVWFREHDQVVFYSADQLYHLKARESLKNSDGLVLGCGSDFSVRPILAKSVRSFEESRKAK